MESNKNILFLNHKEKQCGVYQYGKRTANILKKSEKYNFIYSEIDSKDEYLNAINTHTPLGIIYNYHASTMGWLGKSILNEFPHIIHNGLHHEGSMIVVFDNNIIIDSTYMDNDNNYSIPRPLFENTDIIPVLCNIPIITSFGFGFGNKGFGRVVKIVNEQFDEAIIRLHIPFAYYGDRDGNSVKSIHPGCYNEMKKKNIQLQITTNFLNDMELLSFLSHSTINVFLYDERIGGGLSSVIDYALSVNIPIAITKTYMFRHIYNTSPSICIEDRALKEIINSGSQPLQQYRDKWSNRNLIDKYEYIIDCTIKK